MLEISIIICLAIALFLVLRHYPEATERKRIKKIQFNFIKIGVFFKKYLSQKKERIMHEIKQEIIAKKPELIIEPEPEVEEEPYAELKPEIANLLLEADELLKDNDLREAEQRAIDVICKDKHCGHAYVVIARIALSRGEFDDAKEALKAAIKCDADLAEAYLYLGKVCLRQENYQEALENTLGAISLDRSNAGWYAQLGEIYIEIRQFAKAAKAYKKASAIDITNRDYKDLASEAEDKQRAHASVSRMK
ncbi:MAG: tetratricopeptide repeat protein [bacterium]